MPLKAFHLPYDEEPKWYDSSEIADPLIIWWLVIRPHVELVRAASTLSTCVGHMPINRSMPLEKDSFLDELRLLVCRLPLNRRTCVSSVRRSLFT